MLLRHVSLIEYLRTTELACFATECSQICGTICCFYGKLTHLMAARLYFWSLFKSHIGFSYVQVTKLLLFIVAEKIIDFRKLCIGWVERSDTAACIYVNQVLICVMAMRCKLFVCLSWNIILFWLISVNFDNIMVLRVLLT